MGMERLSMLVAAPLLMFGIFVCCDAQALDPPTFGSVTFSGFEALFLTTGTTNAKLMYAPRHRANTSNFETTVISDGSTSLPITNLASNTVYEVKIQATDAAGAVVESTSSFARTAPRGVTIGYVLPKPTFAVVMFEKTPGATLWEVRHTNMRTGAVETCTCAPGSLAYAAVVTSLHANTNYQVQVRVFQVHGSVNFTEDQSPFGAKYDFTTGAVLETLFPKRITSSTGSTSPFTCNASLGYSLVASSPYTLGMKRLSVFGRVIVNATTMEAAEARRSQISVQINAFYADKDSVYAVTLLSFNANSSDPTTYFGHYEITVNVPTPPNVTEFIVPDTSDYRDSQIRLNAASARYVLTSDNLLFYDARGECANHRDFRTWTIFSNAGLGGTANLVPNDPSPASGNTIEFRTSSINAGASELFRLEPNTLYGIGMDYSVQDCDGPGPFYIRVYEITNDNQPGNYYTIFDTTDDATLPDVNFASVAQTNGVDVRVSFPSSTLERVTKYTFEYFGSDGLPVSITLAEENVDASSNYTVLLSGLTRNSTTPVNVSATFRSYDYTLLSRRIGALNVLTEEDECVTTPSVCHSNATCTNTPTSYMCNCDSGFTGNGSFCEDINECLSSPCTTVQYCVNTAGSFNCPAIPIPTITFSDVRTTSFQVTVGGMVNSLTYNVVVQNSGITVFSAPATEGQVTVPGLTAGLLYNVSVQVVDTDVSTVATQNTLPGTLGGFSIGAVRDVSVEFSWTALPAGFSIRIDLDPITAKRQTPVGKSMEFNGTTGIISALTSSTRYSGAARLVNDAGSGADHLFAVRTSPPAVTGLVTARQAELVNVSWAPSRGAESYRVTVPVLSVTRTTTDTHILLTLDRTVSHTIEVEACNNDTSLSGDVTVRCSDAASVVETTCTSCHADATCVASTCRCNPGFTGNGESCTDNNECDTPADHNCTGGASCHNVPGGFVCCALGTSWDGTDCVDICASVVCSDNEVCGTSGECQCMSGFTGTTGACTDINECSTVNCGNGTCNNTIGSHFCDCAAGYTNSSGVCVEINDCIPSPCDSNAECMDLVESYRCRCREGYSGDGMTCSRNCTGTICATNATCTAVDGEMTCQCLEGLVGNGTECSVCDGGPSVCYPDANCTTTAGGATVCRCHVGYSGTNGNCFDSDECRNETICGTNAACVNTVGSYQCVCRTGFTGDGVSCISTGVDCGVETCNVNATCLTSTMSCQCRAGFTGNGLDCAPCVGDLTDCHPNAICTTQDDEIRCECEEGFTGSNGNCSDLECGDPTLCHDKATCENTDGSYTCECVDGYTGDGMDCTLDCGAPCGENRTCLLHNDIPTCLCNTGFVQNGSSCVDECQYSCIHVSTCDGNMRQPGRCMCGESPCPDRQLCNEDSTCSCSHDDYSAILDAFRMVRCGFESGVCRCTREVQNTGSCFGSENFTICTYDCEDETFTCGGDKLDSFPMFVKPECACKNEIHLVGVIVPVVVVVILLLIFCIAVFLYQRQHLRGWYNVSGRWEQWRRRFLNQRTQTPHFVRTEYQASPQPDQRSMVISEGVPPQPYEVKSENGHANGTLSHSVISNISSDDTATVDMNVYNTADDSRASTLNSNGIWPAPPSEVEVEEPMYAEIHSNRGSVQQTGV